MCTRRFGMGPESIPEVWEESEGPSGGPEEVGKPTRRSGRGRVGFQSPPGGLGGVRRGLEAHPEVRVG